MSKFFLLHKLIQQGMVKCINTTKNKKKGIRAGMLDKYLASLRDIQTFDGPLLLKILDLSVL